ncbi:Zinc finger protein klf1 [Ceratocystis lukuohia]|uniref:Zinc finger protein klf1 n=1 Tax=Ceratocystis lukuohia TaxID=2019550 RepID=A0ABR4MSL6_9PEZI
MASVMGAHADYQLVMSQPEVKPVPTSGHEVNASSPTPIKSEFTNDRGRRRSRSPPDEYEDDDGGPAQSLGGPTRKRRRSRKGLDKKFECPHEGCGKSYSRAEHLHKDRHTAKGSTLNRKDMLASQNQSQQPQGQSVKTQSQCQSQAQDFQTQVAQVKIKSQIKDQDYSVSPTSEKQQFSTTKAMAHAISGSISPDSKTSNIGFTKLQQAPSKPSGATSFPSSARIPQRQQMEINIFPTSSPFEAVDSPFNPSMVGNHQLHQSPGGIEPGHPQTQSAIGISPYPAMSPVVAQPNFQHTQHSAQHPVNFIPHQSFQPSFDLPVSSFPSQTTPAEAQSRVFPNNENRPEFNEPLTNNMTNPTEMMVLEQIQTLPMFGSEGIMNKSPYVSMPNDLINYLFNQSSPINNPVAYQTNQIGYFPNVPQQVMAVNNLLEQDVPEASISEEKSQEIFDYMKKHFIERGTVPADRNGEAFLQGDRSQPTHMLSRRMMQTYIRSYWLHFSDQVPFLHKPTFSPDQTPNLLLLSMMTIGAVCVEKTSNNDGEATNTTSDARLSNFLAWHIRWETFMDNHFRPPAKLWAFQTFLLLELYEKMYATRELHERALIHHATTIAMMRRGRALIGKSARDSPSQRDDSSVGRTSRHSSTPGPSTADDWWSNWIMNESTRRTAFAAFVIDSIHATMFGHSTVMVAHEMRLPLPCDETLWRATSGSEVGRLETVMASNGFKPISFLEGLKRTLQGFEVQTNSFGRTVLMSGLLSVSWHMQQRDLQVNVLGSGVSQALGGRDKWRITLTKAFDSWRQDFDKAIEKARNDPYGGIDDNRRDELNLVFESRTVLHHLAHMAMHVDVIDCQIFARAKRLLGRTIGEADLRGAQRRMKDQWAPTAKARDATWYALNFLCTVLMPEERGLPRASDFNPQDPYSARDDVLLNRPWVVYLASLVVWCYGFALEGPCPDEPLPKNKHEAVQQMKKYLSKYGNVSSPDGLIQMRGLNRSTAVLVVLKDSFQKTRWQLLHEGAKLLENCIALNSGAPV